MRSEVEREGMRGREKGKREEGVGELTYPGPYRHVTSKACWFSSCSLSSSSHPMISSQKYPPQPTWVVVAHTSCNNHSKTAVYITKLVGGKLTETVYSA